jgi:PHD/YefM family antitoxin component YafN of YafNO toxin-antitoxin module
LKESGHPVILTVNGKAEIVVKDARSYQRLLDLAERLKAIEAVREGIASANRGDGRTADEVFDDIERQLRAKVKG